MVPLFREQRVCQRMNLCWNGVISVLEIGCAFPLIAVDIYELANLCGSKRAVYRPCYSYF